MSLDGVAQSELMWYSLIRHALLCSMSPRSSPLASVPSSPCNFRYDGMAGIARYRLFSSRNASVERRDGKEAREVNATEWRREKKGNRPTFSLVLFVWRSESFWR